MSLRRKCIKSYFQKISANGINSNKAFWNITKPFITNKSCHVQNNIMIIENDKVITNEKDLAEKFNNHYVNIVERSCGKKPKNIVSKNSISNQNSALNQIMSHYSNHPSIIKIKEKSSNHIFTNSFQFKTVRQSEVEKHLNRIDTKKATGVNKIPPKLVKLASNILSKPLTKAINNSLSKSIFPHHAKLASITPIDKKTNNKNTISNFRPISLLGAFSKIYEKIIKNQLSSVLKDLLSPFVSAYRECYSAQHVLIRRSLDGFIQSF